MEKEQTTKGNFDPVNLPKHYQLSNGKEVLDYLYIITAVLPVEINYGLGNALKYVGRGARKGNLAQDLRKASYYTRDAKYRAIAGINTKAYKTALKGVNLTEVANDVADFALYVGETYPDGMREATTSALEIWVDYFDELAERKRTINDLNYVLHEWSEALANLVTLANRLA